MFAFNCLEFSLIIDRIELTVFIEDLDTVLHNDALDLSVFDQDFLRTPAVLDRDAFFFCFSDLILGCRHFIRSFQTVHLNSRRTGSERCSCNVDRNVSAADHDCLSMQDGITACLVGFSQEVNAADSILFVRDVGFSAGLHTDGNIECLVTFFTQIFDRDVFADFNTAADVSTHHTDDFDLSINNVFLKTEVRDTVSQHAARFLFFFKDRYRIALLTEIVSSRESGRTRTDDSDLVVIPLFAYIVVAFRYITALSIEFLQSDEFLDLVDCDRTVDRSSCAAFFTALVADHAAYCRERVILFDQLEGIHISAFGSHTDVALYCQVGRTSCLAGCSTCFINVELRVITEVLVPLVRSPLLGIGKFCLRIFDLGTVFQAELLSEFCGAYRADFNALAAGNALICLNMSTVSGS